MKIAVTGGAGYIGSHTVTELLKEGHQVVVLDDLSTGFFEALPSLPDQKLSFHKLNIRDRTHLTSILKSEGVSAIFHFAGKLIAPESVKDPLSFYENNVDGTCSVIQVCRNIGVKNIVFSSSAAVYGEISGTQPVNELHPTNPINPYGSSKLMCEKILMESDSAYEIKSIVLRYFNVAGAAVDGSNGQRSKKAGALVKIAAELATHKRQHIEIFGTDFKTPDGTGIRDYIHVQDLAKAHVCAFNHLLKTQKSEIYNCGYGVGLSVREVLNSMERVSNQKLKILEGKKRLGDPASVVADSSKFKEATGWSPLYNDINIICKSAYEWEQLSP